MFRHNSYVDTKKEGNFCTRDVGALVLYNIVLPECGKFTRSTVNSRFKSIPLHVEDPQFFPAKYIPIVFPGVINFLKCIAGLGCIFV